MRGHYARSERIVSADADEHLTLKGYILQISAQKLTCRHQFGEGSLVRLRQNEDSHVGDGSLRQAGTHLAGSTSSLHSSKILGGFEQLIHGRQSHPPHLYKQIPTYES